MALLDENQMIDQIDVDGPQEKRGVVGRVDVGVAGPGDAGRMVMGHDDGDDSAAQKGAPALRRDDASPGIVTIDAFQPNEPVEGVESIDSAKGTELCWG